MTIKAHIYDTDGELLGFLAYAYFPPEVLEFDGRFFKQESTSACLIDVDDGVYRLDYVEIEVEHVDEPIYICIGCGRNSSLVWWKCCPEHLSLDGSELYCQACVEYLHPGDPEFARE